MDTRSAYLAKRGERTLVYLFSKLADGEQQEGKSWLHVCTEGSWKGHPAGEFDLTRADFKRFIKQFKDSGHMVVDYDHRTLNESGTLDDIKAAGWVEKLEIRDNQDGEAELWAFVDWTETAAEMIRADEIRYCSPVIVPDAIHNESAEPIGDELFNIAITNIPFFKDNQAVQLNALGGNVGKTKNLSNKERATLKANALEALDEAKKELPPDASEMEVYDKVSEKLGQQAEKEVVREVLAEAGVISGPAAAADKPKDDDIVKSADQPDGEDETVKAADALDDEDERVSAADDPEDKMEMQDEPSEVAQSAIQQLAEDLEMTTDAAAAALLDAMSDVTELIRRKQSGDGTSAEEVASMKLQVAEERLRKMSKRVQALEKAEDKRDRKASERVVDDLVARNWVKPEQRDAVLSLHRRDRKTFNAIYADALQDPESKAGFMAVQADDPGQNHIDPETARLEDLSPEDQHLARGFMGMRMSEREAIKRAVTARTKSPN